MRISRKIIFLIIITVLFSLSEIWAKEQNQNRNDKSSAAVNEFKELGRVRWRRDYDEAIKTSTSEKKPVFVFIQDISGVDVNIQYGEAVLSHPLVVEAIESLFIPLAIYNSEPNRDTDMLAKLSENSSNQTVIRIVNSRGTDLTERVVDNLTMDGILSAIIESLSGETPQYVEILYEEYKIPQNTESAIFPVHCFWAGEVELGPSRGILQTIPGKVGEREAIQVVFDSNVTSYRKLLEESHTFGLCKDAYYSNENQRKVAEEMFGDKGVKRSGKFVPDRTPKYYLSQTSYESVPMTDRQAILVNSDLFFKEDPKARLSPRQIQMFEFIESESKRVWKNQINKQDMTSIWIQVSQRIYKVSNRKVYIH
jgi:hypothetical protein